jgi:hypothetical protein
MVRMNLNIYNKESNNKYIKRLLFTYTCDCGYFDVGTNIQEVSEDEYNNCISSQITDEIF